MSTIAPIDRPSGAYTLNYKQADGPDGRTQHTLYRANERGEPVTTEWITSTLIIPLEEVR